MFAASQEVLDALPYLPQMAPYLYLFGATQYEDVKKTFDDFSSYKWFTMQGNEFLHLSPSGLVVPTSEFEPIQSGTVPGDFTVSFSATWTTEYSVLLHFKENTVSVTMRSGVYGAVLRSSLPQSKKVIRL